MNPFGAATLSTLAMSIPHICIEKVVGICFLKQIAVMRKYELNKVFMVLISSKTCIVKWVYTGLLGKKDFYVMAEWLPLFIHRY